MTSGRFASAAPLLALAATIAGCGPKDRATFYDKVYPCNSNAPDPDCGTTRSGAPLTCTPATETLGGTDICAEQCAEGADVVTAEYACLQDGSKVPRCQPSAGPSACVDPALRCFRTDLETDEGRCLPLNTCTSDGDCSATRTACATSLAANQYPRAAPALKLDSLNCMAVGCNAAQTACPTGEQCIQAIFGPMAGVPDVCLPTCDPKWRCPPNHSCLKRLSPAYPDICVPGLLGKPCDTDLDCMIGHCIDVEYGYKVCSRACTADADCIPFDQGETYFFCANNWCVSPESLLWPDCITDADCPDPEHRQVCARPHATDPYGTCRTPCAADGSCPVRAGIIHGCHPWSGVPVCQPGLFGRYECTADSDCAPGLSCLRIDRIEPPHLYCTIACQTDGDCADNRQTSNGYCSLDVCHTPEASGTICDRDRVCASGHCDTTTKTCLDAT